MGVIAESEWRGGEQKKLEFCKVDMPTYTYTYNRVFTKKKFFFKLREFSYDISHID